MSTATILAVVIIGLGTLILLWGKRHALLFAGAGALLGVGLLNLIPGQQDGVFGLLLVFGLAIAAGFVGIFVKGLSRLLVSIIGFLAGGSITLGVLDTLGLGLGWISFVIALIGAAVGLLLVGRFYRWAILILAALTGALLVVRGLQFLTGGLTGAIGTLIWVGLAVSGFIYQSQILSKRKAA